MAKTIKFNLICDGNSVRTLDDLRNNFSIEDIIKYFNNRLLHRWLSVRGYKEELEKVEKLQNLDALALIKELIKIFNVEMDPITIAENTYILQYKQETELLLQRYRKENFIVSKIIADYHRGYRELINTIIENKDDIAKIKVVIKEIDRKFFDLYEMDYRCLFYNLYINAPMAIFVMLMNDNMRKKYLPMPGEEGEMNKRNEEDDLFTGYFRRALNSSLNAEDFSTVKDLEYEDKRKMYKLICQLVSDYKTLKSILGDNLKSFAGETDGYWKDVEPKGKKYMILSIESGNYVRSAGVLGGDLDSDDINEKFVILDGIDYKSNNSIHKLLYMEV